MIRRLGITCFTAFIGLSLYVSVDPVRDTAARLVILLGFFSFPALVLTLLASCRRCLLAISVIFLPLVAWFLSTLSFTELSPKGYVEAVWKFEGSPYVWGGENVNGIDCSGLVRQALANHYLRELRLGAYARIWLFDSTAKELGRVYSSVYTEAGRFPSILKIPHELPKAGAIAITQNGVHVMTYIGNNQWAQASPDAAKVVITEPSNTDYWHTVPVILYNPKVL